MLKRLLFNFIPMLYIAIFPINTEDFYEKELTEKREVYTTSKENLQLFLNADFKYLDGYMHVSEKLRASVQNIYNNEGFKNLCKNKKVSEVFDLDVVHIVSYREVMEMPEMKERFERILLPNDYFVIFPFQRKFLGQLPPYMFFIYRKNNNGEWKAVKDITAI